MKDRLLGSGMPLEQIAARKLLEAGYEDLGEASVDRDGKTFSADIRAVKFAHVEGSPPLPLQVTLFVECKYLRPPNALIFASFSGRQTHPLLKMMSFNAAMVAGIETLPGFQAARATEVTTNLFSQWLPQGTIICHKVALLPNPTSSDLFREAQYQLTFPLVQDLASDLKTAVNLLGGKGSIPANYEKVFGALYPRIKAALFLPLIVTNAPLYILHEKMELSDITGSNMISDIADPHPFVKYQSEALRGIPNFLKDELEEISKAAEALPERRGDSVMLGFFLLLLVPRRFYFVRADSIPDFFASVHKDLVALCRESARPSADTANESATNKVQPPG